MRKPIIAGNWKMNLTPSQGVKLVNELKAHLKSKNIPAVVCTSTDKVTGENLLKKVGVYDYFDDFVFGDMVTRTKPDPQGFLMAADFIGKDPAECLVVEDSPNGVLAGKAAGGCHHSRQGRWLDRGLVGVQ